MRKKIKFLLPEIALIVITLIWYFSFTDEWPHYGDSALYIPLLLWHLAMPLFYFVSLIVSIIRKADDDRRFFIVSSIVMLICSLLGFQLFILYTFICYL